jgi:hypothetical protein
MPEQPKCAFWNYREKAGHDVHGENCILPATSYRYHLGDGETDRLGLYCGEHAYDRHQRNPLTDAVLERARAEDWPFMEWPPREPAEPWMPRAERLGRMQLEGRREHYDFWTGVEAAVKAIDTTIARLEAEDAAEKEAP